MTWTKKKHYLIGKQMMHELKFNGCSICGYNRCTKSLHFHHVNPRYKKFRLTHKDIINSKRTNKEIVNEMRKCVLLCANCHGELHD